ncbi:MAG: hypothetical protein VKO39_00155 [Cyanobacteriota bacterium]|nr:hypothetical protein [Cyanobacteriota bacterium]
MGRCLVVLGLGILAPFLWGMDASTLAAPTAATSAPGAAPGADTPTLGPALRPSTAEQLALVEHLRRQGALFYGAWWCPACFKQKDLFGQQAGNNLPYVECEKTDEQRRRCETVGISAYPTWVLGSRRLEGVQSLEALGQWSGYKK